VRDKVNALARYLELIVDPTFEEFKKNPTSVRQAFLACVAIYHASDRAAYPAKPGNLLKEWRKNSQEFKLVEIVANHFKHVKSNDEKMSGPGIPISFALGLSDTGDTMELRNFSFVIRDAVKFLHQQAKAPIKRNAAFAPRSRR
jgi:hypothetical protein